MSDVAPSADPAPADAVVDAPAPDVVDLPADPGSDPAENVLPESTPAEVIPEPDAPADPFADFGGRDVVEAAYRMYEAARSEDGVIQLFMEAGKALGLGLKDMQALFENLGGEPAEGEDPDAPDPDEPLTRAQFEKMMQERAQREAAEQFERQKAAAATAVQEAVADLKLDPKDPSTEIILKFGDQYVNGDLSPDNVKNAIRRGQADYEAMIEREHQAYLAKKRQQAQTVPQAPAGQAAPSAAPEPEPQNVAEAIKTVRRKLNMGS